MDATESTGLSTDVMRVVGWVTTVCLLAGFLPSTADAHDRWINGDPIPNWVKRQCCGLADAHHLQPSQVHVTADGYRVDGYSRPIPEQQRLRSPDGEWWAFYRILDNGEQSYVYCFFGPDESS